MPWITKLSAVKHFPLAANHANISARGPAFTDQIKLLSSVRSVPSLTEVSRVGGVCGVRSPFPADGVVKVVVEDQTRGVIPEIAKVNKDSCRGVGQ